MFYDKVLLHEDTVFNDNKYSIFINTKDDGNIPHVHITYKKMYDTCIDLDYNCYGNHKSSPHEGPHRPFPNKYMIADVLNILKSRISEKEQTQILLKFKVNINTYWELAKFHWNRSNSRNQLCRAMECPYDVQTFIPANRDAIKNRPF